MTTLRDVFLDRLRSKARKEATWTDLTAIIGALPAAHKDALLNAVKRGDGCAIGNRLVSLFNAKVDAAAKAEAETMLADGALSADELQRLS